MESKNTKIQNNRPQTSNPLRIRSSSTQNQQSQSNILKEIHRLSPASIGASTAILWHRPSEWQLAMLKEELGITMVLTVQQSSERPELVSRACQKNGLRHEYIHLQSATLAILSNEKIMAGYKTQLRKIYEHLCQNQEKLLIHCAKGIHRTGITAYTLLRWNGLDATTATNTIHNMRYETYNGVGNWRLK